MVLIILAIVLGSAVLIWLWKVTIQKTVHAMKKNGSSTAEAYSIVVMLLLITAGTMYMIIEVI